MVPAQGLDQGFALRILSGTKPEICPLNAKGFPGVTFGGDYPIDKVTYAEAAFPLEVTLEAFSPFIPLNIVDSSLPATVLKFTVRNNSTCKIVGELGGWIENLVGVKSGQLFRIMRVNRGRNTSAATVLECGFREAAVAAAPIKDERALMVFEDFEREDWGQWKVEGKAFGKSPSQGDIKPSQKLSGYQGRRLAILTAITWCHPMTRS